MSITLFCHSLHVFDIYNWIRQEISTLLLKILKIILKPHFLKKNKTKKKHLVATIH